MTTKEAPHILFERKGPVGIISLNRPDRLNPLSADMVNAMREHLIAMSQDQSFRAAIITGIGRGFSSGMDVNRLAMDPSERPRSNFNWPRPRPEFQLPFLLRSAPFPVIGAINGVAAGAGMSLALSPDIRIMSDQARLVPIFIKRGVMPDMGLNYLLTRMVGTQKALELFWAAEPISPQLALELRLVARVVPHEKLMEAAMEYAERLSSGPYVAVAFSKRAVYRAENNRLDDEMDWGSLAQAQCMATEDAGEGARAFLQKRAPVFKGQ